MVDRAHDPRVISPFPTDKHDLETRQALDHTFAPDPSQNYLHARRARATCCPHVSHLTARKGHLRPANEWHKSRVTCMDALPLCSTPSQAETPPTRTGRLKARPIF